MRRHLPLLLALALLTAPAAAQGAPAAPSPAAPATVLSSTAALPAPLDAAEPEEEGEEDLEASEEAEELEAEDCEGEAFAFAFELEEEEEEEEETEGFEEEFGFEEAEECGEEDGKIAGPDTKSDAPGAQGPDSGGMTAPAACLVRRAEATVTALPARGRLQITVRYKAYAPTAVTVGLKLEDRKGAATLERATRHLGAGGVLHLAAKVGDGAMGRVEHAHRLDVSLRAPRTPGYCGDLLEARLHAAGDRHRAGAPRVFRG